MAAFTYRFSRRFDLRSVHTRLLVAAATSAPKPPSLIRRAEIHCQSRIDIPLKISGKPLQMLSVNKIANTWIKTWIILVFSLGSLAYISNLLNENYFLIERFLTLTLTLIFAALVAPTLFNKKIRLSGILNSAIIVFTAAFAAFKTQPDYFAPLIFFVFLVAFSFSTSLVNARLENIQNSQKISYFLLNTHLIIFSILFILKPDFSIQQGNRFVAFFSSPTTFSTWITSLLILAFSPLDARALRKPKFIITLILITFFIYASGTRINLLCIILLILISVFPDFLEKRSSRALLLLTYAILITCIYPAYAYLSSLLPSDILAYRFNDGADTSFGLRIALFNAIYEPLLTSPLSQLLFGHGGEASRLVVIENWGQDLYPHNDIIRIAYDYGLVFLLIFIAVLITYSSTSISTTIPCIVYITSFLHNMIFSHYLISIIVINYIAHKNFLLRKSETLEEQTRLPVVMRPSS